MNTRPPLPPFTRESAIEKVRLAEDGWNSRDPAKVALAYTLDTNGATVQNSPPTGRKRRRSWRGNGKKSSIIV